MNMDQLPVGIIDEILNELDSETGFHLLENLFHLIEIHPIKFPKQPNLIKNTKSSTTNNNNTSFHKSDVLSSSSSSFSSSSLPQSSNLVRSTSSSMLNRLWDIECMHEWFSMGNLINNNNTNPLHRSLQSHSSTTLLPTSHIPSLEATNLKKLIFFNITNGTYWFNTAIIRYDPPKLDFTRRNYLFFQLIINNLLPNLTSLSLSLLALHEMTCGIECQGDNGCYRSNNDVDDVYITTTIKPTQSSTSSSSSPTSSSSSPTSSSSSHNLLKVLPYHRQYNHRGANHNTCPFRSYTRQNKFSSALESLQNLTTLTLTFSHNIGVEDVFPYLTKSADNDSINSSLVVLDEEFTTTTTTLTPTTTTINNNNTFITQFTTQFTTQSHQTPIFYIKRFTLPNLQHLILSNNNLTEANIIHLAKTTSFPMLTSLDVSKNLLNHDHYEHYSYNPLLVPHSYNTTTPNESHLGVNESHLGDNIQYNNTEPTQITNNNNHHHNNNNNNNNNNNHTPHSSFHTLFQWVNDSFPAIQTLTFWPQQRSHYRVNPFYTQPQQQQQLYARKIIPLIQALANSPILSRLTMLDCTGMFRYNDIINMKIGNDGGGIDDGLHVVDEMQRVEHEEEQQQPPRQQLLQNQSYNQSNNQSDFQLQHQYGQRCHNECDKLHNDSLMTLFQSPYLMMTKTPLVDDQLLLQSTIDNNTTLSPTIDKSIDLNPHHNSCLDFVQEDQLSFASPNLNDNGYSCNVNTATTTEMTRSSLSSSSPSLSSLPYHPKLTTLILDNTAQFTTYTTSLLTTQLHGLKELTSLSLSNCNLSDEMVIALSQSPILTKITKLNISWNPRLTHIGIKSLCNSTNFSNLTHLNISHCKLTVGCLGYIGNSAFVNKLTHLDAAGNNFYIDYSIPSDHDHDNNDHSDPLNIDNSSDNHPKAHKTLGLTSNCDNDNSNHHIIDPFITLIFSPNIQNLIFLDLSFTNLSILSLKSIPLSPYLNNLVSLSLMGNDVNNTTNYNNHYNIQSIYYQLEHYYKKLLLQSLDQSQKEKSMKMNTTTKIKPIQQQCFSELFFNSPFLTNLTLLNLINCNLTDHDLSNLVQSPYMDNLVQLGLADNEITTVGVELFEEFWKSRMGGEWY